MEITDPARANALIQSMGDEYSRKILLSAIPASKSVEDVSRENDIPLSTCYRRVHELLEARLLVVDRIILTPEGKKHEVLRSAYRAISFSFDGGTVRVDVVINEDVADKLWRIWLTMKAPSDFQK
ncbi:MAG: helix-turn-helix transcriptional regulator [archaeon]|nr:MAG: helix-turn-helix transcriptional regulator [archaeon]